MGPPIRPRDTDGYRRDIEVLARIRIAIQTDESQPDEVVEGVVEALSRAERLLFEAVTYSKKGRRSASRIPIAVKGT